MHRSARFKQTGTICGSVRHTRHGLHACQAEPRPDAWEAIGFVQLHGSGLSVAGDVIDL